MIKFIQYVNPYRNVWQLLLANLILAIIVMLLFYNGWAKTISNFLISLGWSYSICITQWIGHTYINNKLDERLNWRDHSLKRAIFGTLAITGYAVFAFLLVQIVIYWILNGMLPKDTYQWALKSSIYAVSISFGVSLIFTTLGFFKAWKKSLLEAEQFKTEMLAYKYESLQNQINPHFLFNSFNVLSDLVYEDQKKAVYFIKKLSKLFRYVLDSRDKELVPITEELKFIESFAFLLQTRFDHKLNIHINVEAASNEMIVPMALQLLLENCVKHNEISLQKPLNIEIQRKENYIEVSNNLQPKTIGPDSKKIGLENMKQQYKFFTELEVNVQQTDTRFSVSIPILQL